MENENETKWEETHYTEENEEENSYDLDSESSEEEYEAVEENDEGSEEVQSVSKTPMYVLLGLIVVLIVVGVFLAVKINQGKSAKNAVPETATVNTVATAEVNNDFFDESLDEHTSADMLGVGFNDNGDVTVTSADSPDGEAVVADVQKNDTIKPGDIFDNGLDSDINGTKKDEDEKKVKKAESNNSIMVAWNRARRQNPFKPPVIVETRDEKYETYGDVQFEIIEPPTKLLQTQISGILYDDDSPSAIVNLAGKDQFVKVGDEVSGYKIKSITRNKVEISYKNNTYVASVGELFTPGKLEKQNDVSNLGNKFAGRYKNEDIEE